MRRTAGFGLVLRDLPGFPFADLDDALDTVARHGATQLQMPSLTSLSPALDAGQLRRARAAAVARGIGLSATIGPINACWPERAPELLSAGDNNLVRGAVRLAEAAATVGIADLHTTIGRLEDRTRESPSWDEQLERNGELIAAVAAAIEPYGVRLVLKTHEEMSSIEARRIVIDAGHGTGLGLSPVNLLVGMEEPIAAARRVHDVVATVFVDDARLIRSAGGFLRRMEPVGRGSVDWPGILSAVAPYGGSSALVLDLHRARFEIEAFDPNWPAHHRNAELTEFAALASRATAADGRSEADAAERFAVGVAALAAGTAGGGSMVDPGDIQSVAEEGEVVA